MLNDGLFMVDVRFHRSCGREGVISNSVPRAERIFRKAFSQRQD